MHSFRKNTVQCITTESLTFNLMLMSLSQEDVVMGTLTVRENLHFSAALRLPSSVPHSEKEARVNHLIKELGLAKVVDSKVYTHTHVRHVPVTQTNLRMIDHCSVVLVWVFSSGGHTDDPWNLRRREEEDKHRYGAYYWSLSSVLGWTDNRTRC